MDHDGRHAREQRVHLQCWKGCSVLQLLMASAHPSRRDLPSPGGLQARAQAADKENPNPDIALSILCFEPPVPARERA